MSHDSNKMDANTLTVGKPNATLTIGHGPDKVTISSDGTVSYDGTASSAAKILWIALGPVIKQHINVLKKENAQLKDLLELAEPPFFCNETCKHTKCIWAREWRDKAKVLLEGGE